MREGTQTFLMTLTLRRPTTSLRKAYNPWSGWTVRRANVS
jgi:hypothetical protein